MRVQVFPSYLEALAFAAQGAGPQIFECISDDASHGWVTQHVQAMPPETITADIASTLAAWAMRDSRTTGVYVGCEADLGSVIAHYTESGDIVRFIALSTY